MSTQSERSIIRQVAEQANAVDTYEVLQPAQVGLEDWRNELLLFVKPELLAVESQAAREAALGLVWDKLAEFEARAHGVMVVNGRTLEQKQIMDRHYGYINRLSRAASQMLAGEDRRLIAGALEMDLEGCALLGGHEYLATYAGETPQELDRLWFTKKSLKIRSGFYVQAYEKDGQRVVLVNGFHPAQLAHFTDPAHRIVLVLLHSDTPWPVLRNEMIGATFPEKAAEHSIRGTLYRQPERYGLESVTIANNGVHLSAGPFEGLFEISNFFGKILDLRLEETPPLMLKKMMERGMAFEQARRALENPTAEVGGQARDLFTATEDLDSEAAIDLWEAHF